MTSDVGRFGIVPLWLIESSVSDRAVRLFGVFAAKFADNDGMAYPSRATLAGAMGLDDQKSIDRAVKELRDVGALKISARVGERGGRTSNLYQLCYAKPTTLQGPSLLDPRYPSDGEGALSVPGGGGHPSQVEGASTPDGQDPEPIKPEPLNQTERASAPTVPDQIPDLQRSIDRFSGRWFAMYAERPIFAPKHIVGLKRLVNSQDVGIDKTLAAIDGYFDTDDTFVIERKHPIELFISGNPLRYVVKAKTPAAKTANDARTGIRDANVSHVAKGGICRR